MYDLMNKITLFYLISTMQFIHYLLEKVEYSIKIESTSHSKIRTMLSLVFFHLKEGREKDDLSVRLRFFGIMGWLWLRCGIFVLAESASESEHELDAAYV